MLHFTGIKAIFKLTISEHGAPMRSIQIFLFLVLLLALLATACEAGRAEVEGLDDPWGVIEVKRGEPIRIGIAVATTMQGISIEGLDQLRGAELAAENRGAIRGHAVELVVQDAGCSAGRGPAAAFELTRDRKLVAVIGHTCSQSCLSSVQAYDDANFTMISPSCGASALTDEVTHIHAFLRTIYDDSLEGESAARFAYNELAARRVGTIHDNTRESDDFVAAFEATFTKLGGTIVASEVISPGTTDMQSVLNALEAAELDLVYAPLMPTDAVTFTLQRMDTPLSSVPLLGNRHYWSAWFLARTSLAAEGIYASGPMLQGQLYERAFLAYTRAYDETPNSLTFAHAYDAMGLILQAVEGVGVPSRDGDLEIGRRALQRAIYDTANYPGITGDLTCTHWGDCSSGSVGIGQAQRGKWVSIYIP